MAVTGRALEAVSDFQAQILFEQSFLVAKFVPELPFASTSNLTDN